MSGNRRRVVARAWMATYARTLKVAKGDMLRVEERDSEWPGWLWATGDSGSPGWIPIRFVERREADEAVALRDYDAIELTVTPDDVVEVLEEESGWAWCEDTAGARGWVPLANLSAPSEAP